MLYFNQRPRKVQFRNKYSVTISSFVILFLTPFLAKFRLHSCQPISRPIRQFIQKNNGAYLLQQV